ncbi:MAG TPA: MarR family transcriptional regulator [Candidatus Microsaccharimonas sp.]|nr:MarR family transcriptional regulator [Candidatus Microsaccharimonas sp.]
MKRTELIASLFDTMDVAKRSMHSHMQTLVAGHRISRSQLELLFTIHHTQPTTAKDLAKLLRLTPGAISQVLEELTEQQLITRQTDSSDRRRQVLSISDKGNTLIKEFEKRRHNIMHRVIQDLTDEELAIWLKIHQRMIDEFDQETKSQTNKETA